MNASHPPLPAADILIVDDTPTNLRLITEMLRERGFKTRPVLSGELALQAAKISPPDLILLDINMPELDGYAVSERLKADARMREVPVIFLSARDETIDKVRAFRAGGVDYISKPFQIEEVEARVNVHLRLKSLRQESEERSQQLEAALKALQAAQNSLRAELSRAAEYVLSLLPSRLESGPVRTDWRMIPSTQLGGDALGYHWLDQENFVFYLLDVSGHGVGSALHSVAVLNTLRNHSLPGVDFRDPGEVLTALNKAYLMRRHASYYFTIGYGVLHVPTGELHYGGGGHPAAIVRMSTGKRVQLSSGGPPIGCFEGTRYAGAVVSVAAPAELCVFSDGIFDVRRPGGSRWSFAECMEYLASGAAGVPLDLDAVHRHVVSISGGGPLADDFSMLTVSVD